MFKGQANERSEIGRKFACSIRAFGGFKMDSLSDKLDLVKTCIKGYYDAGIVLVGTVDLISDDFEMWSFMEKLKKLLLKFHYHIGCKHVVVIGFIPRAFCKSRTCSLTQCLYIHPGFSKVLPSDLNIRVWKVNKAVNEIIKYDERFKYFKFMNCCDRIMKLGSLDTSYGNFLSYDGLHLSKSGNHVLDNWLTKFLSDMEW